jgi:hypothetical protein
MFQTHLLQTFRAKVLQTQQKVPEVLQQHLQGYRGAKLAGAANPLCEEARRLAGNAAARQAAVQNNRICGGGVSETG